VPAADARTAATRSLFDSHSDPPLQKLLSVVGELVEQNIYLANEANVMGSSPYASQ
jgi:hypothetical protein